MLIAKRRDRPSRISCCQATVCKDDDGKNEAKSQAPQQPSSPSPSLARHLLGQTPLRPT